MNRIAGHNITIYSNITDRTQNTLCKRRVSHKIFAQLSYHSIGCICVIAPHYSDVINSTIASQITSLTIVYSTVYSGADQRKHQSSASLASVWGIHRWSVDSPHKRPVTQKIFPFDDVIMRCYLSIYVTSVSLAVCLQTEAHISKSLWRHRMETFSALLALCNRKSIGHRLIPLTRASDAELWATNRDAGDLRRHRAHHDFTAIYHSTRLPYFYYCVELSPTCWYKSKLLMCQNYWKLSRKCWCFWFSFVKILLEMPTAAMIYQFWLQQI